MQQLVPAPALKKAAPLTLVPYAEDTEQVRTIEGMTRGS